MRLVQFLHTYQCSLCQTVATSPIRVEHPQDLPCVLCRRWMRLVSSVPVTTPEQRDLFDRGTVFQPYAEPRPRVRYCDTCFGDLDPERTIRVDTGGRYCSQTCVDIAADQVRLVRERLEQLYQRKPWLKPATKETA